MTSNGYIALKGHPLTSCHPTCRDPRALPYNAGDAPLPYLLGCPGPGLAPDGPLLSALGLPRTDTHTLVLQQLRRLANTQPTSGSAQPADTPASAAAAAAKGNKPNKSGAPAAIVGAGAVAAAAAPVPTGPVVLLDPGRMCALYSHLEREAHVSGHDAAVDVCRAFAEHPLIWVPGEREGCKLSAKDGSGLPAAYTMLMGGYC